MVSSPARAGAAGGSSPAADTAPDAPGPAVARTAPAGGTPPPPGTTPAPDRAGRAPSDWSGRRADARRNHDLIMAAALEVFAEKGLNATVPEVAARAGVGKATVYRSYPTKADLVRAVAEHQLRWIDARVAAAAAEPDPYLALHGFLHDMAERLAHDLVLLIEVLPRADPRTEESASTRTLARIVEAAREQGSLRPDATAMDVRVLLGGYARILAD